MRSLFGRKVSVQDIEREVTEELETMVRSGKNPPPASWTLLGGLYGNERSGEHPAPHTEGAVEVEEEEEVEVVEEVEVLEDEAPGVTADPDGEEAEVQAVTDDPPAPARPKRARKASSSRPRTTTKRSGTTRASAASSRRRS